MWVPRKAKATSATPNDIPEAERWYFLEEKYPKYGNIVPRDIATRERSSKCATTAMASAAATWSTSTCATRSARSAATEFSRSSKAFSKIYEKFVGTDPLVEPMKIFPAVHYTMGGLWAGFVKDPQTGGLKRGDAKNMMTNIPGLYAMGECSFAYHGANRLGANSLLSCIFDGLFGGTCIRNYAGDLKTPSDQVPQAAYDQAVKQETDRVATLLNSKGKENPYELWNDVGHDDDRRLHGRALQRPPAEGDRLLPDLEAEVPGRPPVGHRHVDQPETSPSPVPSAT